MKWLKRIYFLKFKRKHCFRNTLEERCTKWGDNVEWGDIYLGNDWWYRPPLITYYSLPKDEYDKIITELYVKLIKQKDDAI